MSTGKKKDVNIEALAPVRLWRHQPDLAFTITGIHIE